MHTRIVITAVTAALAASLVGCSTGDGSDKADSPKSTSTPTTDEMVGAGSAKTTYGVPTVPTGARRAELLRALAAVSPDIVKYEDKAIEAARNQCAAFNGDSAKADQAAVQRFIYKDVAITEAQGKQINTALKDMGFCEV
jgi:Flp pilus assembly protein TadD